MYYLLDEYDRELDKSEYIERVLESKRLNPGSKIVDREGVEIGR